MNTNDRQNTQRTDRDHREDPQRSEPQRPPLNPRLVFADPDRFFRELIEEQMEES